MLLAMTISIDCCSRGTCLTRFYSFFHSLIEFLKSKDKELPKNDITYLIDPYKRYNDISLPLQLNKTKNTNYCWFRIQPAFLQKNISRRESYNHSNFSTASLTIDDLCAYYREPPQWLQKSVPGHFKVGDTSH